MRDPKKSLLVAKKLADWHRLVQLPGDRTPRLFPTLWKWLKAGRNRIHSHFWFLIRGLPLAFNLLVLISIIKKYILN